MGFSCFPSWRQLWGCLQGQVVLFTTPFPDWAAQRPMPGHKKLCLPRIQWGTRPAALATVLRAAVSSAVELVLGGSPRENSQVEVMNELTTKF
jgi:hypothetical protein